MYHNQFQTTRDVKRWSRQTGQLARMVQMNWVVPMEYDLARVAEQAAVKAALQCVHKDAQDIMNCYRITFSSALVQMAASNYMVSHS